MKKKRRSKRSGRLWAAGCLTVILCAGIIFYGYRMARDVMDSIYREKSL